LAPVLDLDIMHILRLCYVAEIVKVVLAMARNTPAAKWLSWAGLLNDQEAQEDNSFQRACSYITKLDMRHRVMLGLGNSQPFEESDDKLEGFDQECFSGIDDCKEFVKKYALVFLRKASLLLYVRYGTDFNSFFPHNSDDELGRLSEALRLPSFDEICDLIGQKSTAKIDDIIDNDDNLSYDDISTTQHIIWGWIHAHFAWQTKNTSLFLILPFLSLSDCPRTTIR
jgi:E3 ubiquitin-protein ligase UBR1